MTRLILNLFENFLFSDGWWRILRLVVVILFVFAFAYLGRIVFPEYNFNQIVTTWTDKQGILKLIPDFALEIFVLPLWDARYFIIPIAAFLAAFIIGSRYIQEVFNLNKFISSVGYLLNSLFGLPTPLLKIESGKLEMDDKDFHPIRDIGGPGRLVVNPGNIVLFENLQTPSRVCPEGTYRVNRFETLKLYKTDETEIPILADKHGYIEETLATTKDGIGIRVKDIQYRYRLQAGQEYGDYVSKDTQNPNPYSVRAVSNMTYKRSISLNRDDGKTPQMNPWHATINFAVDGAITSYIQNHLLDDVIAPRFSETPRDEIANKIFKQAVRGRMLANGAELLWWDIGHFEIVSGRVSAQLVKTWAANWEGLANVRLAFGEAKRQQFREIGFAESQADMLKSILNAFREQNLHQPEANLTPQDNSKKIQEILLERTARILELMGGQGNSLGSSNEEIPPPSG
jgi:hypothetical protein